MRGIDFEGNLTAADVRTLTNIYESYLLSNSGDGLMNVDDCTFKGQFVVFVAHSGNITNSTFVNCYMVASCTAGQLALGGTIIARDCGMLTYNSNGSNTSISFNRSGTIFDT